MAVTAKGVNFDERGRNHVWDQGAGFPIAGAVPDHSEERKSNQRSVIDTILNQLTFGQVNDADRLGDVLLSGAQGAFASAKDAILPVIDDVFGTSSQTGSSAKPIVYSDWSPAASYFGMDQSTAYAEHMVNTAHQREVADLKAAGLNPVLGVSGSGASSVSGSMTSGASSAEKGISSDALVDVIGATAALLTVAITKKPYLAAAVGQAAQSGGNLLFGD